MCPMEEKLRKSLEKALKSAGGPSELSRKFAQIGVSIAPQSISGWKAIPVKRVIAVETLTGIPRFVLRPDIYPKMEAAQ